MFTPAFALTSKYPKFLLLANSIAKLWGTCLWGKSHLLPKSIIKTLESIVSDIDWNHPSNAIKLSILVQSKTRNTPTAFLKKIGERDLNYSWPNVSHICNWAHVFSVLSIFTNIFIICIQVELCSLSLNISFTYRLIMLVFPTR